MADRFPLIANTGHSQIQEIPSGDNLNLSNNSIVGVTTVTATTVNATTITGDGSGLTGVASTDNIRTNTNATFLQNVNVSGTVTATSFSGTVPSSSLSGALPAIDGSALTGIGGTANVRTGILDVAGIATFRDNIIATTASFSSDVSIAGTVSIGGTLTYEDVTNVDSVGLITARNGIVVGSGITLSPDGDVFTVGVSTFTGNLDALGGVDVTGNITATSNISDTKGNVRIIPKNSQSSSYTLVAADSGKHIFISSGGVTIPASIFDAGDAITIINNSGSDQTITCSAITTYLANDTSSKSSLTLKGRGVCTFIFVGTGMCYGAGAGLE